MPLFTAHHDVVLVLSFWAGRWLNPGIYLIAHFLKRFETAWIVIRDKAPKDQVGVFFFKPKPGQSADRIGAKAAPPKGLGADHQVDAASVFAGILAQNPIQIHPLKPTLANWPALDLDNETESALRDLAVYPLDLVQVV